MQGSVLSRGISTPSSIRLLTCSVIEVASTFRDIFLLAWSFVVIHAKLIGNLAAFRRVTWTVRADIHEGLLHRLATQRTRAAWRIRSGRHRKVIASLFPFRKAINDEQSLAPAIDTPITEGESSSGTFLLLISQKEAAGRNAVG